MEDLGPDVLRQLACQYLGGDTQTILSLLGVSGRLSELLRKALPWADLTALLVKRLKRNERAHLIREPGGGSTLKHFLKAVKLANAAKLACRSQEKVIDLVAQEDHLSPGHLYEISLYRTIRHIGYQTGHFLYFEKSWYFFAMRVLQETTTIILETAHTLALPYMGPRGGIVIEGRKRCLLRQADIINAISFLSRNNKARPMACRFPTMMEYNHHKVLYEGDSSWVDDLAEALGVEFEDKKTSEEKIEEGEAEGESAKSTEDVGVPRGTKRKSNEGPEGHKDKKLKTDPEKAYEDATMGEKKEVKEIENLSENKGETESDEGERSYNESEESDDGEEKEYEKFKQLTITEDTLFKDGFWDELPITERALYERAGYNSDFIYNYENAENLPKLTRVEALRNVRMSQRTGTPGDYFHDLAVLQLVGDCCVHVAELDLTEAALEELKPILWCTLYSLFELAATVSKGMGFNLVGLRRALQTAWTIQGGDFRYFTEEHG